MTLRTRPMTRWARSAAGTVAIHVVKDTRCKCCNNWVEYLRAEGFAVTEKERYDILLPIYKSHNSIPEKWISCHTGSVEVYALEAHVPAADIRRC